MKVYFLIIAIPASPTPRPFFGLKATHMVFYGATAEDARQEAWEYWDALNVDLTKFAKNEIHVIQFDVESEDEESVGLMARLLESRGVPLGQWDYTSQRKLLRDLAQAAGLEMGYQVTDIPIDYFTYGMVKKELLESHQDLAAAMGHRKMVVLDLLWGAMCELEELGYEEPYWLNEKLYEHGATMYALVEAYWKHLLAFHAKKGNFSALDVAYKYTPRKFAKQLLASKKLDAYIQQAARNIEEFGRTLTDEDLKDFIVTPDMVVVSH